MKLRGADEIHSLGVGLDHAGGVSAGIGDGVVDAGGNGDVLPQELHADVHQLQGVQGAAPQLGGQGGVGGYATEVVTDLVVGGRALRGDHVDVGGVPAEGQVQTVEHAGPGHKAFAGAALLCGAAEEFDRARHAGLLQVLLHRNGGGQGAYAKQVMSAAVAGSARNDGLLFAETRLLAESGEGVKLSQKADHRAAAAKGPGKGGLDTGQIFFYQKALLSQGLAVGFRGEGLVKAGFRMIPEGVAQGKQGFLLLVQLGQGKLLL